MKHSLLLLVAAATLTIAEALFPHRRGLNWTIGQPVRTTSGLIHGHAALNKTEVSVYLGIPYALPPVGDLRWEAPKEYTGNASLSGSSFVSSKFSYYE